jgi:hypothetical protein
LIDGLLPFAGQAGQGGEPVAVARRTAERHAPAPRRAPTRRSSAGVLVAGHASIAGWPARRFWTCRTGCSKTFVTPESDQSLQLPRGREAAASATVVPLAGRDAAAQVTLSWQHLMQSATSSLSFVVDTIVAVRTRRGDRDGPRLSSSWPGVASYCGKGQPVT